MEPKPPKLEDLLSHRPLGRTLRRSDLIGEFELIRDAFLGEKKNGVPGASEFAKVGAASGTHLLKLITPRASADQCVLRFIDERANRKPEFFPSLNAAMAPIAKLVYRPLEVEGSPAKSLADHILNPDELSQQVTEAFAKVFGDEALEALRIALTTPPEPVTELPAAEFPVIFLPRPGGGDLQATPVAPPEAYIRFGDVTEPYFKKQEEGEPRAPRGRWHRQVVADKPQNISSAIGKQRVRFLAEMPKVLDGWSAELLRFSKGGRFPQWRDPDVPEALKGYAKLLDTEHSNQDIREGLNRRADQLIAAARAFIDETVAEVRAEHPDEALPRPPLVQDVLSPRKSDPDYNSVRRALTSEHFKGRLKHAGEVP